MKKRFALLLALALSLSLTACGGDANDTPISNSINNSTSDSGSTSAADLTDAQLQELTEVYNEVAVLYNEVATAASENGWLADAQTAADIQSIGDTLDPIGIALTEDLSDLDGANFDTLPDVLREFLPMLETLAEQVSQPYNGDGTTVVTDEALIPVANAVNEVIPLFNEVYAAAEANGWLDDPQTAAELQAVKGTLTFTQSALTDDPSKLENVTDFDALAESILQFVPALEEVAERVSVPYEG